MAEQEALAARLRARSRCSSSARTWCGARATRSWSARIVARARGGRLPVIGSGAALIDTTYVDNAAAALVAAVDACGPAHGEALVVSNGEPRPVGEMLARLCQAAGVPGPRGRLPLRAAWLAGAAVEGFWALDRPTLDPSADPVPRRSSCRPRTGSISGAPRTVLGWRPEVGLDEGFARLADWYAGSRTPG